MQVFLKIIGGKNDGREIKISVPEFVIGRGDTAHLKPSSDLVSRRHCSRLQFEMVIDAAKASVKKEKVKNAVEAASRTVEKKKTGSLEDSITDWLADDSDVSPFDDDEDFNPQDTVQLSTSETQEILAKETETSVEESETEDESESVNERKDGQGKLPPVPKSEHADSTNAAGDVLKQFFNRR